MILVFWFLGERKKSRAKTKPRVNTQKSMKIPYIKICLYKLQNYVHNCAPIIKRFRPNIQWFFFKMYLMFAIMIIIIIIILLFVCDFQRNTQDKKWNKNFGIAGCVLYVSRQWCEMVTVLLLKYQYKNAWKLSTGTQYEIMILHRVEYFNVIIIRIIAIVLMIWFILYGRSLFANAITIRCTTKWIQSMEFWIEEKKNEKKTHTQTIRALVIHLNGFS